MHRFTSRALCAFLLSLSISAQAFAISPTQAQPKTPEAAVSALQQAGLEAESSRKMTRKDYGKAPYLCRGVTFLLPSIGPDKTGQVFYCPRKNDVSRLSKYYVSLGDQSAELFVYAFTAGQYLLVLNGDLEEERAGQYEQALLAFANVPAVAKTPEASTGIVIEVQKMGYDNWGRPHFLDDPNSTSCGPYDDSRPMLRFLVSLAITNNTGQTWKVGTRLVKFFKADGVETPGCYYDYMQGANHPETKPGEPYAFTYMAFLERNERIGYVTFEVEGIGKARLDFPKNIPLP